MVGWLACSSSGVDTWVARSEEDEDWYLVDSFAAYLLAAEDEGEGLGELPITADRLDRLVRVRRPMTGDALAAVGRSHPNAKIAKAARKAALQARSDHAATPLAAESPRAASQAGLWVAGAWFPESEYVEGVATLARAG